jgi:hypothetical protein
VINDQDTCVASGQYVLGAEHVFDQRDEDGIVVLRDENPPAEQTSRRFTPASFGRRHTGGRSPSPST